MKTTKSTYTSKGFKLNSEITLVVRHISRAMMEVPKWIRANSTCNESEMTDGRRCCERCRTEWKDLSGHVNLGYMVEGINRTLCDTCCDELEKQGVPSGNFHPKKK